MSTMLTLVGGAWAPIDGCCARLNEEANEEMYCRSQRSFGSPFSLISRMRGAPIT